MTGWIDMHVDVLASSTGESSKIQIALQKPSTELLAWVAKTNGEASERFVEKVMKDVTFRLTSNLGYAAPAIKCEQRFENEWPYYAYGAVWSQLYLVSREFYDAVFLVAYCDTRLRYAGRVVLRAGREVCAVHDGHQQTRGYDWLLPDVFAPYLAEYRDGSECGVLWDSWLMELESAVVELRNRYGTPNEATTSQPPLLDRTKQVRKGSRITQHDLETEEKK
jgi:hypothetical protein